LPAGIGKTGETMSERRQRFFLFCSAILALAGFVRIWNISGHGLWTDELGTLWVASAPSIEETISRSLVTQGQSPFYFILEHLTLLVLPPSEITVRLLSVASSLLTVAGVGFVAFIMFRSRATALFSALCVALCTTQIYYAQEARPYALALLFAVWSQFFFWRFLRSRTGRGIVPYVMVTVAMLYAHYFMVPLLLLQNAYFAIFAIRSDRRRQLLKTWIFAQIAVGFMMFGALPHVLSILDAKGRWQWMTQCSFAEGFGMLLGTVSLPAACLAAGVLLMSLWKGRRGEPASRRNRPGEALIFVFLWWVFPFLFLYFASAILGTPLVSERYLVLAVLPAAIFCGRCLSLLRHPGIRLIVALILVVSSFFLTFREPLQAQGGFVWRIPHDWRGALRNMASAFRDDDAVLLRFGDIRENWIPAGCGETVVGYVRCPFQSWYWASPEPLIESATYTIDESFYPYYDRIIGDSFASARRLWVIGVDPPNTNYRIADLAKLVAQRLGMRPVEIRDFSGVHLGLFERNGTPEATGQGAPPGPASSEEIPNL
jgi:mannosyltransferase